MKDYTKQCWFCNYVTMIDKGGYYLCSSCGATWNPVPRLGPDPLADSDYILKSEAGVRLVRARRARPIRKSKLKRLRSSSP